MTFSTLGCIRCRFKDTSDITKAFGKKIGELNGPHFIVSPSNMSLWTWDEKSLECMESEGIFCAPISFVIPSSSTTVDIKFTAGDFPPESISGCPVSVSALVEKG